MKQILTMTSVVVFVFLLFSVAIAADTDAESLTITGDHAAKLEELAAYKNLRSLTLLNCPAVDLAVLASCSKLSSLTIQWDTDYTGTGMYDLSPLQNCSRLHTLALIGHGISDLSVLPKISKLSDLTVRDVLVSDYTPITKLSLKHLSLFGADASSVTEVFTAIGGRLISAVVGNCTLTPEANDAILQSKRALSLAFCSAEGIDGDSNRWAKLTNLTSLTIDGGSLSSLQFCNSYISTVVVKLTDVFIGGAICSVDFDKYFLKTSDVPQNEMLKLVQGDGRRWQYATVKNRQEHTSPAVIAAFADVSGLLSLDIQAPAADAFDVSLWDGFSSLEQLKISDCQSLSLRMLTKLPGLRRLVIQNASVTDADAIGSLFKLQQLSMTGCTADKWTFTDTLSNTSLSLLNISRCNGPDTIKFTKDLEKLKVLALEYSPVTDISPITGSGITNLYLFGTSVSDFTPLAALPSLALLYCDADAALPALSCRIVHRPVTAAE